MLAWLRGHRTLASLVALAVIAGVPTAVAVLHKGFPVDQVDLKAQDVWVTNGKDLLGGRLNHQIGELDASVNGSSANVTVLQDGDAYFLYDPDHGSVQRIDPAYVSLTDQITVPKDSQLGYGKDTLAILAPSGQLWVLDASTRLNFDASKTKPVAKLGTKAQLAVSKEGETFAVSTAQKKLVTVSNARAKPTTQSFSTSGAVQLSAVGDTPVVLDKGGSRLRTADKTLQLPKAALKLQQPSGAASSAVVASGSAITRVPLNGGTASTVASGAKGGQSADAAGTPAPVQVNGCVYAAWATTQRYLYDCTGKSPVSLAIDQPVTGADLAFRVNHGIVALNNLQNGQAWDVSSHMTLVQNWAELKPVDTTKVQSDKGQEQPVVQSYEQTLATRTSANRPPVAVDDHLGVRPGRTTILPILDNDNDPDGDVLTISRFDQIPASYGHLDLVDGGRALQFTPAQNVAGTVSFKYSVDDGRGGSASAQVDVTVHQADQNAAPVSQRTSTVSVEVGQSVSYDVLQDWLDPDGDGVYLVAATPTTPDGVSFTPDGYIQFTSTTGQVGVKTVDYTVSDGQLTATGTLTVTVAAAGSLDPIAVPDFAAGSTGTDIVVHPLANDISPSGDELTLVGAQAISGGISVNSDPAQGTVTVNAPSDGTYYLNYTIGAGAKTVTGLIRIDATSDTGSNDPPLAVNDTAYLHPSDSTTVDVLDNDVSPSGRVLAVKSVTDPDDTSLNVQLLDNTVVRITAPGVVQSQVQLQYVVSDGVREATGTITVVPVAPLVNHQPPVAVDDYVTVRAGDLATADVTANDYSPDDEPFDLAPKLVSTAKQGDGATAFVSGSVVRYQAPKTPGTYSVDYGLSDRFGNSTQGTVNFTVTAADPKDDRAPEPQPLTARAFAGSAIPITVPLDGIDPDGDSVTFDGISDQPTLGRITGVTSTGFTYQAFPSSSGTDDFSYTVEDAEGKQAQGEVRIGVVQRPTTLQAPVAVNDTVEVKPGKTAAVSVLANDSDPNGYPLVVQKKLSAVDPGLKASVDGTVILFTAPKQEGAYVARYSITNEHGGTASAYVQVIVTDTAKDRYPTAQDQVVAPGDVKGKKSVTVDALRGATNPSGLVQDLKVGVSGANAGQASVHSDGTVSVKVGDQRTVVTFSVTDATTGLSGSAFIVVPPAPEKKTAPKESAAPNQDQNAAQKDEPKTDPPHLKYGLAEQIVPQDGSHSWSLSSIVDVPSGRPASLSGAPSAQGGTVKASGDSFTFTAKADYRGQASVAFQVDDGKEAGASADRITTLVLPITVGNPDQTDVKPTFTPPKVQVEPGEAASSVDLRAATYHPNQKVLDAVTYGELQSSTVNGVQATLKGSTLSVSAPVDTKPGTTAVFKFNVHSGAFIVPGSVNVSVTSSTRPIATQKNPPQTLELKRGTSETFPNAVGTQSWVNPFPDTPLQVTNVKLVSAPTGVSVSSTANSITVKAASGAAIGSVNITYQVIDATKDPNRTKQTSGQLQATIHDVPSAPKAPTATAGDAQATVTLHNGVDNHGKTVTECDISDDNGKSVVGTISGSSCSGSVVVKGLKNGTAYSFTARAVNVDGNGPWSAASTAVTPYGTPAEPTGLSISANKQYAPSKFALSWKAVASTGGTTTYHWRVDGKGGWTATTGTSATSAQLDKGSHYFEVYATNTGSKQGPTAKSKSVSIDDPPPPAPSVTLARGSGPITSSTCTNGCFYYKVSVQNFPANSGPYTVTYHCGGGTYTGTEKITTNGNGSGGFSSTWDYCGYSGTTATVNGHTSDPVNFKP